MDSVLQKTAKLRSLVKDLERQYCSDELAKKTLDMHVSQVLHDIRF